MSEIAKLTCEKCGHIWVPTKEDPRCCPRCKSYDFRKKPEVKK